MKSVSEAVSTTIIENKKTQNKETETERSAIIYGLKEDDVKNYDNRIESDMAKLSNLINNGIKIQMQDIIKVHWKMQYKQKSTQTLKSSIPR